MSTIAAATAVVALAACVPDQPLASSDQSVARGSTLKTFLPWNQNRKRLGRYDLGWQASPQRHPGNGLSLAEVLWAYTYSGKDWATYPGLNEFHLINSSRRTEDGRQIDLDVTDPRFADYISDVAVRQVRRFGVDGVMLDGWVYEARRRIPRAEQNAARVKIARAIRSKVPDDFIIMGNVNWRTDISTHPYLNGVYVELFKKPNRKYTPSQMQEIERLMILHDRHLRAPRIVAVEAWRINRGSRRNDAALNERYARLFAAMTAVVPRNGYFIYADNNSDSPHHDHDHVYYGFYGIDLGKPTGGAVKVRNGVKYKRYQNGIIAFNRTGRAVRFSVDGVGTVEIEGESGIFCRKESDGLNCGL